MKDLYKRLRLPPSASADQIAAKLDAVNPEVSTDASFVLLDQRRRKIYDTNHLALVQIGHLRSHLGLNNSPYWNASNCDDFTVPLVSRPTPYRRSRGIRWWKWVSGIVLAVVLGFNFLDRMPDRPEETSDQSRDSVQHTDELPTRADGREVRAGARVESETLGLVVSSVPAPFTLKENDPQAIRFAVRGKAGEVTLSVEPPPEVGGVNLVAATKQRLAWFEQQPGGKSFGSQELVAQFGSAFTARGRYLADDGTVEELWTFGLHPQRDRMLQLVYRYPAGTDSPERAQELLALIGEIAASMPAGESPEGYEARSPEASQGRAPNRTDGQRTGPSPYDQLLDTMDNVPQLSPIAVPSTGIVSRQPSREFLAPFEIVTRGLLHYFFKVVEVTSGETVATFFVRAGETLQTELPLGSYRLRYVAGETWYGKEHLFGPDTPAFETDKIFEFEMVGERVTSYTVEMWLRRGGNLEVSPISPGEF